MLKGQLNASTQAVRPSKLVRVRPFTPALKTVKRVVEVRAAETGAPAPRQRSGKPISEIQTGAEYEGKIVRVEQFGAFVDFGFQTNGLLHISQLPGRPKSAAAVLKAGEAISVRVMSVDAEKGRIALTPKDKAPAAEAAVASESEEEVIDDEEDMGEDLMIEVPAGFELVTSSEEPDISFLMEEEDAEMTLEGVAAFEALDASAVEREVEGMSVPIGELVSGKVARVEDYGVFVEFSYNGRNMTALLPSEEAKVPAAALSAEQLAQIVPAGEEAPEFVEFDFENIATYYPVGTEVSAFVLEYNDRNQMSLTQFADWEVQEAALALGDEEADEVLAAGDLDALAQDPLALLEEEAADAELAFAEEDDDSPEAGMRAEYTTLAAGASSFMIAEDLNVSFPSRPLNRVNSVALTNLGFKDTDFDNDEIELNDYWQESFVVPKSALKRLGLKITFDEAGNPQVAEREGATKGEFAVSQAFSGSQSARVRAFVKDLLADDEDEAEVPARAARKPVVLAAAVQNISATVVKELRNKTGAGMMDCKKALAENDCDMDKAIEWLRKKGLSGADKKAGRVAAEGAISSYIHPGSRLGVLLEVNCETDFVAASDKFQSLVRELGMIIASCPEVQCVSPDDVSAEYLAKEREIEMNKEDIKAKPEAVRAKIVEGRIQKIKDNAALLNQASLTDPNKTVSELVKEAIASIGENIQVRRFIRYNLGEGLEKRSNDFAAEVAQQTQAKAAAAAAPAAPKVEEKKAEEPKKEEAAKPAIAISATVVKELRDKTGAGMMDCKKALAENGGDMDASIEWLRKKGLAGADKKAGRLAAEGGIIAYIHPGSRLGVLMEMNCETDFVAASDKFQALAKSVAMQIAASPTVQYVTAEDIPAEVYAREKEIEMGREDLKSKPEAIRAKIAEGRTAKLAQDMALLPQPYLMNPEITVEQAVKEAIAAIGEKISIRRFIKFQLGEGIEKKTTNLAEEVAAATGQSA